MPAPASRAWHGSSLLRRDSPPPDPPNAGTLYTIGVSGAGFDVVTIRVVVRDAAGNAATKTLRVRLR
ncbi:MAG TPA: hypothetical protein VHF89_18375 [Solirubrobacteraceae bacterium]|nr:hypothetical protein [Solirubrobacteraceae bacterium]